MTNEEMQSVLMGGVMERKIMMLERKLKQARERMSVLGDALVEADLAVCCEGCQEIFLNDEIPESGFCEHCEEQTQNKLEFKRNRL